MKRNMRGFVSKKRKIKRNFKLTYSNGTYTKVYLDKNGMVEETIINYNPSDFEYFAYWFGDTLDEYGEDWDPETNDYDEVMQMTEQRKLDAMNILLGAYDDVGKFAGMDPSELKQYFYRAVRPARRSEESLDVASVAERSACLETIFTSYPTLKEYYRDDLASILRYQPVKPLPKPYNVKGEQCTSIYQLVSVFSKMRSDAQPKVIPIPKSRLNSDFSTATFVKTQEALFKIEDSVVERVEDIDNVELKAKYQQMNPPQRTQEVVQGRRERELAKRWRGNANCHASGPYCTNCNMVRATMYRYGDGIFVCQQCVYVVCEPQCRKCSGEAYNLGFNWYDIGEWRLPVMGPVGSPRHSIFCEAYRTSGLLDDICKQCGGFSAGDEYCGDCLDCFEVDEVVQIRCWCGRNWHQLTTVPASMVFPSVLNLCKMSGAHLVPQQHALEAEGTEKKKKNKKSKKKKNKNIQTEVSEKKPVSIQTNPQPKEEALEDVRSQILDLQKQIRDLITVQHRLEKELQKVPAPVKGRCELCSQAIGEQEAAVISDPVLPVDDAQVVIRYEGYHCNGSAMSYEVWPDGPDRIKIIARFVTVAHDEKPTDRYFNILNARTLDITFPSLHPLEGQKVDKFCVVECNENPMNAYVWARFYVERSRYPDCVALKTSLITKILVAGRWNTSVDKLKGTQVKAVTIGVSTLKRTVASGRITDYSVMDGGNSYYFEVDCSIVEPDSSSGPGSSGSILYILQGSRWLPLSLHFGTVDAGKTNSSYSLDFQTPPLPKEVKAWIK